MGNKSYKRIPKKDRFTFSDLLKLHALIPINEELWKDINGIEGVYQVSNFGRVRLIKKRVSRPSLLKHLQKRILKGSVSMWNYHQIGLTKNKVRITRSVHRLVALAFIPNPENKPQVNHKNGIRIDNRVSNLEWATKSEDELHSYNVLGKIAYQPMKGKFGKDHNKSKPVYQCSLDGTFIKEYGSRQEAHRVTGISVGNINSCTVGRRNHAGGFIWKATLNS